MLIINTGGTFNKRYDPIKGELFVPQDNSAIEAILTSMVIDISLQGILYKDSLEMDDHDRFVLGKTITESEAKTIIVVHGTDTMDVSAEYVASLGLDKVIVFTGAMIPFTIDPLEATANLSMAIGYANNGSAGVHIVMQGIMGRYEQVKKNKSAGKFEYV
ncbi:MAG: asparaginase domain-containing protein [Sulfuricurvum sp.]|uniref:asparaginase domain-containing protein n=1 Tax=Sulfuricurvum sp. TaxID=2025608 RepID=UPI0027376BFE|nr:asparaginase domain-containing protein [Sulfuricurvum sp.]MDP2850932.1 asparaginase domain-containing protein [Sulfuricurvum sp.]MDP3291246.1 asparaginase domain-containing protein [Sulfuricurvum sp.]